MRNATDDFVEIVREHRTCFSDGVVHSFTGNWEDVQKLLELDLWIGLNGCSMKSQETINAIRNIPIDRIMIESDAPWCEIRKSHAGYPFIKTHFTSVSKEKYSDCADDMILVKSRNEPSATLYKLGSFLFIDLCRQVLEVVAALKGMAVDVAAAIIYENSAKVFK